MTVRSTLIQGGRVIDPASNRDEILDVLVGEDGKIQEVGAGLSLPSGALLVDASGLVLLPGFIDLHVHFREPGFEYKETVETGCASAVAGGFTTVACMANTKPVNDNGTVTRFIVERAKAAGIARVLPIGALSKGMKGQALAEVGDMIQEGAIAISDDGLPIMDAHLMRCALEYTRTLGVPVIAHEEDNCLGCRGAMNEGPVSTELGMTGIPNAAEDVMVARDIILAELTGGHLHVAHVSTAASVQMIREAQAKGLKVTTEVTPHHFTLTDDLVRGYDPVYKMAPPLRAEADRAAMIAGLKDGTIACIATDHAPHATVEKEVEFELASFGITGLETAWGLTYRLVQSGDLDLMTAVRLLTSGPADCFGLELGRIEPGAEADLVLIDLEATTHVRADRSFSKSSNTPFAGWDLPSRVERTFFGGKTVYLWDGEQGVLQPCVELLG